MDVQLILILAMLLVFIALITVTGIRLRDWLSGRIGIDSKLYTFDRLVSWLLLLAIMSGISVTFGNNMVVNYEQEFAPIIPWVNLSISIISALVVSTIIGFKKWLRLVAVATAVIFEVIIAYIIAYTGLSVTI